MFTTRGRRRHRGGRGDEARRRSCGSTSIRSRASSPTRRGGSIYGAGVADPSEQKQIVGDRRAALRGVRRLRRDALRDQPADRDARRRGEGARLEVHGRRQRALQAPGHRRDATTRRRYPPEERARAREGRHVREARRRGRASSATAPGCRCRRSTWSPSPAGGPRTSATSAAAATRRASSTRSR